MKWTQPKDGDERVRRGFLWFPLTIESETRWLEYAEWKEFWRNGNRGDGSWGPWWEPAHWTNKRGDGDYFAHEKCPR